MAKKQQIKKPIIPAKSSPTHPSTAVADTGDQSSRQNSSHQTKANVQGRLARWGPWSGLVPVILALLTSINGLENGFVFDDNYQILGNEFIKDLSNVPSAFTSSVWAFLSNDLMASQDSYFRPFFTVLFSINQALFGTHAGGWHFINVVIHAAVTYFVFLVCRAISGRPRPAYLAAAMFAVHPVHVESVAWLSGITDPLMELFLLPSFLCYLRYKQNGRRRELVFMLLFFFFALLCKEAAILLPVVIAYCELFYFKESAPIRQRLAHLGRLV